MPENEYLAQLQAKAAEALAKKQTEATAEAASEQSSAQEQIEKEVTGDLRSREASIVTAKKSETNAQKFAAELSVARSEAEEFDKTAQMLQEAGIEDPVFNAKHETARARPLTLETQIAQEKRDVERANSTIEEIEGTPEDMNKLRDEALAEDKNVNFERAMDKASEREQAREAVYAPMKKANDEILQNWSDFLGQTYGKFDSVRSELMGVIDHTLTSSDTLERFQESLQNYITNRSRNNNKEGLDVLSKFNPKSPSLKKFFDLKAEYNKVTKPH